MTRWAQSGDRLGFATRNGPRRVSPRIGKTAEPKVRPLPSWQEKRSCALGQSHYHVYSEMRRTDGFRHQVVSTGVDASRDHPVADSLYPAAQRRK